MTTLTPHSGKGKKPKSEKMLGWHFAEESECLCYGDGRKIVVGKSHKVDCKPVLCEAGLHASKTIYEALQYAPGPILYRVELRGKIVHGDDKSCATERHYISKINAEEILREFARKCALKVIHLWDAPRIVREYLETGDESKRDAAWDAARAAATRAAAQKEQSEMLDQMVLKAMGKQKSRRAALQVRRKLTKKQIDLLALLDQSGPKKFEVGEVHWAVKAPLRDGGLIEQLDDGFINSTWRITEAGRTTLAEKGAGQ